MKTVRVIALILAWFNLLFWGIPILTSILQLFTAPNALRLVMLVLFAAIPLNSFAALQLHRCIRNPAIKLNHQTPVGIRFVGTFALVIGGFLAFCGIVMAVNARELLPAFKEQMAGYEEYGSLTTVGTLQKVGIVMALLGLAAVANVILNMRLLRWYYLVNRSDVS